MFVGFGEACYQFWLGAHKNTGNSWEWYSTGDDIMQSLWGVGQPSGDGHCGHIWKHVSYINDITCSALLCVACQIP